MSLFYYLIFYFVMYGRSEILAACVLLKSMLNFSHRTISSLFEQNATLRHAHIRPLLKPNSVIFCRHIGLLLKIPEQSNSFNAGSITKNFLVSAHILILRGYNTVTQYLSVSLQINLRVLFSA